MAVRVALLVPDPSLQNQLVDRLRAELSQVPWQFVPVDSGERLIAELRLQPFHLALIAEDFAGGTLKNLTERMMSITGDLPIVGFVKAGGVEPRGIACLQVPIVNWSLAIQTLVNGLSEDIKMRFGLKGLKSEVRRRLAEWGQKYQVQRPSDETVDRVLQFPASIQLDHAANEISALAGQPRESTKEQIMWMERKTPLWTEILVIVLTGSLALVAQRLQEDDSIFSVARLFTVVFALSILAFFLLRALERTAKIKAKA